MQSLSLAYLIISEMGPVALIRAIATAFVAKV